MPGWVSQLGSYIGIIVFVGAVVVYLRGARDKGTIATLESSNKALSERVALLEAGEKRLTAEATATEIKHTAEIDALNLRIKTLEKKNADLEKLTPSAEAIQSLRERLEMHDAVTQAGFVEVLGNMTGGQE